MSDEMGAMDAIQRFTGNVVRTTYDMLLASALAATKTFILDTLGVSVPVSVHVRLQNGRQYSQRLDAVLGSPAKPLSRAEHVQKFRRCWQHGGGHLPADHADRLIDMVEHLEDVDDVRALCRLLVP